MTENNRLGCCGQKRQSWQQENVNKNVPSLPAQKSLLNPVILSYRGSSSFIITGKITGNTYLFAGNDTGLNVDERDVPELLEASELLYKS